MGSSFTILNNSDTVVYVSSDIEWGILGPILLALGGILALALTVATGGTIAPFVIKLFVGQSMYLMSIVFFSGIAAAALVIPGALGITALATVPDRMMKQIAEKEGMDLGELKVARAKFKEMTKGMYKLVPNMYYKFEGTLSLSRRVKIIYDDGAVSSTTCWTGALDKENREYRVQDHQFKTSVFAGCYKDSKNRIMENFVGRVKDHKECMYKCRSWEFFGMEYGDECFCSMNMGFIDPKWIEKNGITKEQECDQKGRRRGGAWRLAAFKITPSKKYNQMYHWRNQNVRRMEIEMLGNATTQVLGAETRRLLGEDNEEIAQLIQDFADFDKFMEESAVELSSEELASDHRRLEESKQRRIAVEVYQGDNKHDFTTAVANHLTEWMAVNQISAKDMGDCSNQDVQQCDACVDCIGCMEDNTQPICSEPRCLQCDHCAKALPCVALQHGCASAGQLKEQLQCLSSSNLAKSCGQLRDVMKCVASN